MAANSILNVVDELKKIKMDLVSKQNMFSEKISNENKLEPPEDMESYASAYNATYKMLQQKDKNDVVQKEHKLLPYIDETYEQIQKTSETINNSIDMVNFIDDLIKQNYTISNSKLDFFKEKYDKANIKYKSKIDVNSATKILKMDTYDRNIEENFFIMYYLISYGVIGYFMYKLLKMQ